MNKKIKFLALIMAFVVLASSFVTSCAHKKGDEASIETKTTASTTQQTTITTTTEATTIDYHDKELEQIITDAIPTNNGEWSVYYKNLSDGKFVSINNKKMVSASLIKLFIMGMVYDQINSGKLEQTDEIDELMDLMITISHNDSSNRLVEIAGDNDFQAGMGLVNNYALSIGCPDTEQQRNMLDSRPVPVKEQNYTSVEDCGKLLEMIYNKQCVSPEFDEHMLDLMLHQQRDWKIPAGLPSGVKVANKTGELSTVENDVAIIFTDNADYILCVISNDLTSTGSAQNSISNISTVVYDYVTKKLLVGKYENQ